MYFQYRIFTMYHKNFGPAYILCLISSYVFCYIAFVVPFLYCLIWAACLCTTQTPLSAGLVCSPMQRNPYVLQQLGFAWICFSNIPHRMLLLSLSTFSNTSIDFDFLFNTRPATSKFCDFISTPSKIVFTSKWRQLGIFCIFSILSLKAFRRFQLLIWEILPLHPPKCFSMVK